MREFGVGGGGGGRPDRPAHTQHLPEPGAPWGSWAGLDETKLPLWARISGGVLGLLIASWKPRGFVFPQKIETWGLALTGL